MILKWKSAGATAWEADAPQGGTYRILEYAGAYRVTLRDAGGLLASLGTHDGLTKAKDSAWDHAGAWACMSERLTRPGTIERSARARAALAALNGR